MTWTGSWWSGRWSWPRRPRGRGAGAAGSAGLQPVVGAGRMEDMINLMRHALRKALGVIAPCRGRTGTVVCHNSYMASDLGFYPRHSCSSASPTCS